MTKDAKEHFYGIQYFDVRQIKIKPKILCFEIINTKDESSKSFFRVYESALYAETSLNPDSLYLFYDEDSNKVILETGVADFQNLISAEKSLNETSKGSYNHSLSRIMKSEYLADDLITFANIYLEDMAQNNPDLTFETKDREEFWDIIDKDSTRMQNLEALWPMEDKNIDTDQQYEEDLSSGLVMNMDNPHWRLKSPDEIDQTEDDYGNIKFEIENDMEINFQKAEDLFDPDELSIYRVSITPLTEGSIIKRIEMIRKKYDDNEEDEDEIGTVKEFEEHNDIVFIRTNLSIFDNQQVNSNQIFIVSSPYTIFLWFGQKVEDWVMKGSLSIFRLFSYEIRGMPLTFYPSHTDEEQNLGAPNLQIIFKGSEPARFKNLFRSWTEVKFPYLMLYANDHYASRGPEGINKPRCMTITGKMAKLDAISEEGKEGSKKTQTLSEEHLKVFKSSVAKKHNTKGISSLVNVDITPTQRIQMEMNKEVELTNEQGAMIRSMKVKYFPQRIFCTLPGDINQTCRKIAKGRIYQYEIQGSKYVKSKNALAQGIFERNVSYFIIVHKSVTNTKGLGLTSNNAILMWRGTDGMNVTKNAIEKYITTPFREIKIKQERSGDRRNMKKQSVFVSRPSELLSRTNTIHNGMQRLGSFGMETRQPVSLNL